MLPLIIPSIPRHTNAGFYFPSPCILRTCRHVFIETAKRERRRRRPPYSLSFRRCFFAPFPRLFRHRNKNGGRRRGGKATSRSSFLMPRLRPPPPADTPPHTKDEDSGAAAAASGRSPCSLGRKNVMTVGRGKGRPLFGREKKKSLLLWKAILFSLFPL